MVVIFSRKHLIFPIQKSLLKSTWIISVKKLRTSNENLKAYNCIQNISIFFLLYWILVALNSKFEFLYFRGMQVYIAIYVSHIIYLKQFIWKQELRISYPSRPRNAGYFWLSCLYIYIYWLPQHKFNRLCIYLFWEPSN